MAGQGNNEDPSAALGFMGRLSGAMVVPVVVYMLLWQVCLGFLRPRVSTAQLGSAVSVLSVIVPFIAVLAAVVIAGRRSGSLIGGAVMMLFFLYLYLSSAVILSWGPPLLTLLGIGLAAAMARWCPTLGEELFNFTRR